MKLNPFILLGLPLSYAGKFSAELLRSIPPKCNSYVTGKSRVDSNERIEKILYLISTVSNVRDLKNVSSAQFKAACWIMYEDPLKLDVSYVNILQRYILTLFYFSTNGEGWGSQRNFLSKNTECNWAERGVTCRNNKVRKIYMGGNNLKGQIPYELGYLDTVNELHFPNNFLTGSIPSTIGNLVHLHKLELQNNSLKGTIPKSFSKLDELSVFDITKNGLSGTIPLEFGNLTNLKWLYMKYNSFGGTFYMKSCSKFTKLEMDCENVFCRCYTTCSYNMCGYTVIENTKVETAFMDMITHHNFTSLVVSEGTQDYELTCDVKKMLAVDHGVSFWQRKSLIDFYHSTKGGGWSNNNHWLQEDVSVCEWLGIFCENNTIKKINLPNNNLNGSIPSSITDLNDLEEIYLDGNMLKGEVPKEFGTLQKLRKVSLSHNHFEGILPAEMSKLKHLELLHLHNNKLQGNVDIFDYKVENFISDCVVTIKTKVSVECKGCSVCCNEEDNCIDPKQTWPKTSILMSFEIPTSSTSFKIGVAPAVWLIIASTCLGVALLFFIYSKLHSFKPENFFYREVFQRESVYRFFLYKNFIANCLGFVTYLLQISLLFMFLMHANFKYENNFWKYPLTCTKDKLECDNSRIISSFGWFIFLSILIIFLSKDLFDGIYMIHEGVILKDVRSCFAGCFVLDVALLSLVIAALVSNATATTDVDLFVNAVAIVILNEVGNKFLTGVQRVATDWVETLEYDMEMDIADESLNIQVDVTKIEPHVLRRGLDSKSFRRSSSLNSSLNSSMSSSRGSNKSNFVEQVLSDKVRRLEKEIYQLKGKEMDPTRKFALSLEEDDIQEMMRQDTETLSHSIKNLQTTFEEDSNEETDSGSPIEDQLEQKWSNLEIT